MLDWPDDVAQVADALDIDQFAVMGVSLGGAYAAACAYALPDRVTAAALVSSSPRLDLPGGIEQMGTVRFWNTARDRPWVMRLLYRGSLWAYRRSPRLAYGLFSRGMGTADRAVVSRLEVRKRYAAEIVEAGVLSVDGLVDDMRVPMRPWGFELEEIRVPVHVWQGDGDPVVPPACGRTYARQIPHAQITICEGQGHFLIEDRAADIIRALVGAKPR